VPEVCVSKVLDCCTLRRRIRQHINGSGMGHDNCVSPKISGSFSQFPIRVRA
jgi:hypothetical protein